MQLPRYKDALTMGKAKVDQMMAPVKARSARKRAELKMCEIEEKIEQSKATLHQLCTAEDLCFDSIVDELDDLDLHKRRQKQYGAIIEQMFPADE